MTTKKGQGSNKRRLQDSVLVRMDAETYDFVVNRGRLLSVSNATVIRDLLISEFEHSGASPSVKRKRGNNRRPSAQILRGLEFLAAINRVGNNFNQAMRDINTARKAGDIDPFLYRELMSKLDKLAITMAIVKNAITGDLVDDEDDAA
ncbi:hypothetical protein SAMN04488523_12122 [Sulfitobacter brevis]|uniref:Mobilisation protein (MobC) n=1 Tax=Sulfitobacter brevis TaxID=74348 RepID=A0A1I2GCL5_9RHOB|nr:hypothetical protein [Sulfitobacter brevis]SFF14740.1 hypothetical protein SAMN04488523_12122 [Sulfitobacter brevis]